jgi:hypothetical protein
MSIHAPHRGRNIAVRPTGARFRGRRFRPFHGELPINATRLFLLGIALIAVHVVDDNFIQPEPGTSAGDHLVSGLVPLTVLGLVAWAYPRMRGAWQGATALVFGLLGIAAGSEGYHYATEVGASGDDFTSLLCLPAGVLLLGVGAVTLWRTRRTDGSLWWRYPRRALIAAAAFVPGFMVAMIALSYGTTHNGRAVVPADRLGVPHEDVTFETADGLELEGWYIPSRNGAAVISFPGRNGSQKQARILAKHGYGVLLFDRRGEGRSEGEPNSWGWGGDADAKAAIDYLQRRPDVDDDRIGAIGLSVGGEMLIETAAETDGLKAVVSDGAGARSYREERHYEQDAVGKVLGGLVGMTKTASIAVFSNHAPPASLRDLAAKVDEPLLLIAAPNSQHGEELNRLYARAAGETATLWEIPEAHHVGGIDARPEEYERRVVGFFDEALAR